MTKRIAIVFREKCHPTECGNYLCAKLCPVNRMGIECITKGEDTKAKIDEGTCTGCGICPKRCPFGAIKIVNLPEKLKEEPIHRYGINMFELFSLPTPVFNHVVGVVGPNAMGKSSAIKILAGVLKPNLGDLKSPGVGVDELIKHFQGTEAQAYFEKLKSGEITVAYKPQMIELIPKTFQGTVENLLKKVDEKGQLYEVAGQLDLTPFLDRNIKDVSGGELQRIAIAATVLRNANLYIFDEPSSFLDIKQRIKVSRFIRSLASEKTAVLVIEHDLVILDYMTDSTHIMYGSEGAFGIVSGLKSTREGINAFLEGFLREENIRFRDYAIKFEKGQPVEQKKDLAIISWTGITKKLGTFSLAAAEGTIYRKDIIGVLGENGIGKTSFVKLLAGMYEPDAGVIDKKAKVSYKPQYLETDSEMLVVEYLQRAIQKYHHQIVLNLGLETLYTKKLSQLSGGELQRVAIAHALAEDAELYLLDEPSAYLDIEQRLHVAKIIKQVAQERGVAVLVVDHDLVFMDNVADKLLVFEGQPAVDGTIPGPFTMADGMNHFLSGLQITLRRDPDSHRPRINKPGSVKDREQQAQKKYYYV